MSSSFHALRDHPRVCGEKARTLIVQDEPQGSPPRMRGKVNRNNERHFLQRITPAYAGKRERNEFSGIERWDHPRVCGEKRLGRAAGIRAPGSPPRMRGKVNAAGLVKNFHGITPAYAGKSGTWFSGGGNAGDHPRVCGEKTVRPLRPEKRRGSPPRMRGKAGIFRLFRFWPRITPAYAGKSR